MPGFAEPDDTKRQPDPAWPPQRIVDLQGFGPGCGVAVATDTDAHCQRVQERLDVFD